MAVTPRDTGAQKRFTEQLASIRESLIEWEGEKTKIMAQMKSVMNLQQQLQSIHRCKSTGNVGVLKHFPGALNCLEGKLLVAQQRAIGYMTRDRKSMSRIVSVIYNLTRKLESLLVEEIGRHDVEVSTVRTAEQFSLCDYMKWGEEIRHTLSTDWPEMRSALLGITEGREREVGQEDIERVWRTWELGGVRFEEFRQLIRYTILA